MHYGQSLLHSLEVIVTLLLGLVNQAVVRWLVDIGLVAGVILRSDNEAAIVGLCEEIARERRP